MSNPRNQKVNYDADTWERLQAYSQMQRRSPADQAALIVKEHLDELERRGKFSSTATPVAA